MSQEIYRNIILPIRERLFFIAKNMLGNEQEAEDAVQELLLKLWLIADTLDKYDKPSEMAKTAMKNHCLDKLKNIKREVPLEESFEQYSNQDNPHQMLERKDTEALLIWIIGRLPQLQQLIIKMKDVQYYEVEQIAEITGTTVEAVRMNLSRARKKVRQEYLKITSR